MTSSKYITFIERSLPTEAFATSRRIGLSLYNQAAGNWTWAASVYGQEEGDDTSDGRGEGYGAAAYCSGVFLLKV